MINFKDYLDQKEKILEKYLEDNVGSYEHSQAYYGKVITLMANNFFTYVFSADDVSSISEMMFVRAQNQGTRGMSELPDIFTDLLELSWEMRNKPERAVVLKKLEKYRENLT